MTRVHSEFPHKVIIPARTYNNKEFITWCERTLPLLSIFPSERTWDYRVCCNKDESVTVEFQFKDQNWATLMALTWT